jgi:carboxy-terminal domain RNA polymerase II polypeptide A small phosphatase
MEILSEDSEELRKIDEELRTHAENLTVPKPPYLPVLGESDHKYCLVVDLDETLIHYNEAENYYLVRPGVNQFMKELQNHFELVLFTASVREYADWIMDQIDPERCFKHRLYR